MNNILFSPLAQWLEQRYERYLPSAFDDSLSMLEKINKMIEVVNQNIENYNGFGEVVQNTVNGQNQKITELENDINVFKQLVETQLLPQNLEIVLNTWKDDGTLETIINDTLFESKADKIIVNEKTGFIPYGDVTFLSKFDVGYPVVVNMDKSIDVGLKSEQFTENLPTVYFDPTTGNDANDGLTSATSVKTYGRANTVASSLAGDRIVIECLQKYIPLTASLVTTSTKNITFKGHEEESFMFTGYDPSTFVWTQESNVYKTTRTGVSDVYDLRFTTREPYKLKKVTSLSLCMETRGSWYTDGTLVYVNTLDSRQPDTDILLSVLFNVGVVFNGNAKHTVLVDIVSLVRSNTTSSNGLTLDAQDGDITLFRCGSHYSKNMGMEIKNFNRCNNIQSTASHTDGDCFNYHGDVNSEVVEIGCYGHHAGVGMVNNNFNISTAHDGMKVFRVGTIAHDSKGPVIADVNGCISINIHSHAHNALNDPSQTKSAFYFDNLSATQDGLVELYGCSGGGIDTLGLNTDGLIDVTVSGFNGTIPSQG